MEIKRVGSQPSAKGPSEWFTGTVRIDPLIQAPDPALVQSASVTFEPGARTAWHTHPLGQTLIVTAGCGRAQRSEHLRSGSDHTAPAQPIDCLRSRSRGGGRTMSRRVRRSRYPSSHWMPPRWQPGPG